MVGEVYAPCGAQPLQVNECIDADKQASPLMSEITASATSKGWILVVTAVREGTAAASFLTTSCARDLTPMDKVFVDCVDAQQSMTFLAEDLEVASYKSDQVK